MNENQESSLNKFLMPGSVVAVGFLIAGAMVWNNQHPVAPQVAGAGYGSPKTTADISKVKIDGEPFIGNPNAPITIAVWSDFQCPFCKKFEQESLTQIIENYVKTGKVKVVYKDFAFLGPDSSTAALYGRAVWALYPAQYQAWHEAMFTAQDAENGGFGDEVSVQKLTAGIAGIDGSKVSVAVKSNKTAYQEAIDADRAEAETQGISATPSIVIGKTLIPGAQPYTVFKGAIDAVIK